jgi:hypothetical protein
VRVKALIRKNNHTAIFPVPDKSSPGKRKNPFLLACDNTTVNAATARRPYKESFNAIFLRGIMFEHRRIE